MINGDYILVKAPEWFKGKRYRGRYCYEHHLVWEKETGLPVPDGCIIHHKDHNKHNNVISNLQMMSIKEHSSLHKRPRKNVELLCPYCKKPFVREARLIKNKNLNFCSRQCCGSYYFVERPNEEKKEKDKKENIKSYFLE